MVGHSARVLGGSGGMLPRKYLEIVSLTITTLFCIVLNILRSHKADLFASWGGGGGRVGGVRAHPAQNPCLRAYTVLIFSSDNSVFITAERSAMKLHI